MNEWSATVVVRYVDDATGWTEMRTVYAPTKIGALGKIIASYPVTQRIEIQRIHTTGYKLADNGYTVVKC